MHNHKNLKLADGRRLSYAEYGPPEGAPVIAFHGTPGSRLEQANSPTVLRQFDTRLIVVDRPGYGQSDFYEDRQLLDWPDDVTQLADSLHLDRFSILGFSGGGAYAAACAAKIPERLIRVALLSSTAPFDAPGVIDAMLPANRALFEAAGVDFQQVAQQLDTVIDTPETLLKMLEDPAPPPDKTIFSNKDFRPMYLANLAESFRQGFAGLAYDMSLLAQPWHFDLAAINVEVCLWHGAQDINVPLAMGQYLATTIPKCQAYFQPDAGHLLMFGQGEKIFQQLMGRS